jgi:hypothetical protein
MIHGSLDKSEREIKVHRTNENQNTTYQNHWTTVKAILIGKFTIVSAYIKNQLNLK